MRDNLIKKKTVVVNSISSVVAKVLNALVLVWLYQYLLKVKEISPSEYSIYPVLMSIMAFAPFLTSVLTSGIGRYVVEAYARDDRKRISQIVSTIFLPLAATASAILALGLLGAWYIDHIFSISPEYLWDARIMMALLMFLLAVRLPLAPFTVGLFVRQKFVLSNIILLCTEFLRIGLLFILLFAVSTRVLWIVTALVIAETCGQMVTLAVSMRLVPSLRFRLKSIHWPLMKELVSFGSWNAMARLADAIRKSADLIILNHFGTALDVSNFHIGSVPLRHIQQGSVSATMPLQPVLTTMHAQNDKRRLGNTYLRGGRYALWVSLLLVVPLIIFRKELILVWVGETYLTAATVMALLLALFPIQYGNVMLPKLSIAKGILRPWAIRSLIMQLVNLGLTIYLVGFLKMGAIGSALSTFIILLVGEPLLQLPLGLRLSGVSLQRWLRQTLIPGFVPGLSGAVVWFGCGALVRPDSWISLIACGICGAVVYLIVLFTVALQPLDRKDLLSAIKHIQSRIQKMYRSTPLKIIAEPNE